jgi:hypothetical protein
MPNEKQRNWPLEVEKIGVLKNRGERQDISSAADL